MAQKNATKRCIRVPGLLPPWGVISQMGDSTTHLWRFASGRPPPQQSCQAARGVPGALATCASTLKSAIVLRPPTGLSVHAKARANATVLQRTGAQTITEIIVVTRIAAARCGPPYLRMGPSHSVAFRILHSIYWCGRPTRVVSPMMAAVV